MIELPRQTAEIFNLLSRGYFISDKGSHANSGKLYRIIKRADNFKILKEHYSTIGFSLESGDGYYYFSKPDENVKNIESKILAFERYIDILDLFTSLENKITIGSRFRISKIVEECSVTPRLKEKLQKIAAKSENFHEKVKDIIEGLARESFIELEDEIDGTYKVLDSFNYLIEIVSQIKIYSDDDDKAINS